MKIQNIVVGVLLLVVVGGGSYFAYRRLVLPNRQCDVCGRDLRAGHESTILLKDGSTLHACCPRCALHHELHNPGQVEGILVADHTTGEKVRAQEAVYVEGSDELTCIPESSTPPREPGVEYHRDYDRCLPSLVAFKEEEAARKFLAAHGGRLLSYGQALESVRKR
jgi:ribosomal protein L24E